MYLLLFWLFDLIVFCDLIIICVCHYVYVSSWPMSARSIYHLGCSKPRLRRPLFFSWTLRTLIISFFFSKLIIYNFFLSCPAYLWSKTKSPFPLFSFSGAPPKKFPASCQNCDIRQIYAARFLLELWCYAYNICSSFFIGIVIVIKYMQLAF